MAARRPLFVSALAILAVGALVVASRRRGPDATASAPTVVRPESVEASRVGRSGSAFESASDAAATRGAAPCTAISPRATPDDFDIAVALLPDFDPSSGATLVREGDTSSDAKADGALRPFADASDLAGRPGVLATSCTGERAELLDIPAELRVARAPLLGPPELLAKAGLTDVFVARVIVGVVGGLCEEPAGFLALVRHRRPTLEIVASTRWSAFACSPRMGSVTVTSMGDEIVLLEDREDASGEQQATSTFKYVCRRTGPRLACDGIIATSLDQLRGAPNERKPTKATMAATLESTDGGLVAHEVWTFFPTQRYEPGYGLVLIDGAAPTVKRRDRFYYFGDAGLESIPPYGDTPAP